MKTTDRIEQIRRDNAKETLKYCFPQYVRYIEALEAGNWKVTPPGDYLSCNECAASVKGEEDLMIQHSRWHEQLAEVFENVESATRDIERMG